MRISLAATVTNATTSYADVTGLSFGVTAARTYRFRAQILYTVNATTTNGAFAISGPASPTTLIYRAERSESTSARTITEGITTYDGVTATGNSAATAGNVAIVEGIIKPSVDGIVVVRFNSDTAVASAVVAQIGSTLDWHLVV